MRDNPYKFNLPESFILTENKPLKVKFQQPNFRDEGFQQIRSKLSSQQLKNLIQDGTFTVQT